MVEGVSDCIEVDWYGACLAGAASGGWNGILFPKDEQMDHMSRCLLVYMELSVALVKADSYEQMFLEMHASKICLLAQAALQHRVV